MKTKTEKNQRKLKKNTKKIVSKLVKGLLFDLKKDKRDKITDKIIKKFKIGNAFYMFFMGPFIGKPGEAVKKVRTPFSVRIKDPNDKESIKEEAINESLQYILIRNEGVIQPELKETVLSALKKDFKKEKTTLKKIKKEVSKSDKMWGNLKVNASEYKKGHIELSKRLVKVASYIQKKNRKGLHFYRRIIDGKKPSKAFKETLKKRK